MLAVMANKPQRKFVLVEVETHLSNVAMADQARRQLDDAATTVLQVHVNASKKAKAAKK